MSEPKCPQCNALIKIPPTGLTMTCEFCSHAMPVPDAKARQSKIQKQENRRKSEENKRRKQAEKQKAREAAAAIKEKKAKKKQWKDRGKFIVSIPGKIILSMLPFVGLLVPLAIFYHNGMLDRWIGDPGTEHYRAAAEQLVNAGYSPVSQPTTIGVGGFGGNNDEQFIQLQQGYCYVFVVGSGEIISQMNLTDPKGKMAAKDQTRGYSRYLEHCPKQTGLFAFNVTLLEENGRYTSSLYYRPAPPPPVKATTPAKKPATKTQKKRRSKRRR